MSRSRHIPEAVRRRVEYFDGQTCAECGRTIDGDELLRHLDHRTAFSEGGEHAVFNLDCLCHECNQQKGAGDTARTEALTARHERQDAEIGRYFQETDAHIVGNDRLREPQEEGYIALRDYFEEAGSTSLPAIVVLPTGCGKSGLIACAPFGIAEGRVLVVAPNLTIKDGLANGTFSGTDHFYQLCDVLPPAARLPRVVALERGRVNEEDCRRADVIVTNVQQMQGWLPLFPSDFFDMIVVDEAHHAPADSWQNINDAFPDAKKLYLTATPFRSDDRPIRAEPVYRYRLADAIAAGYVKNIVRVDAVASEMTFTVEGEERSYTRREIMDLREETWFSRGVALSDVCNETIVDRSVQLLQAKNRRGTERHQIIAAACSIRHAEQVAALYRARGVEAAFVSSDLPAEEREDRLRAYAANQIDAMVHVGILGEGYDNKNISIAALFRPFRSVAPYTQFVGRALRALPDGTETDNLAHVVAHAGLNQEGHWQYFKQETEEAQVLADLDAWAQAHDDEDEGGGTEDGHSKSGSDSAPAEVTRETIEGFDVDAYLPVEGEDAEEAKEHLQDVENALDALREKGLDVPDADAFKREIAALNQPLGDEELPPPPNRPARERHAYRKMLDHAVRRAAGTLLRRLDIPEGTDLVDAVGKGEEESNVEVVIRLLNRRVNAAVGRDNDTEGRNAWPLATLKEAKERVPAVRDAVLADIADATNYSVDDASTDPPTDDEEDETDGEWSDLDDFEWGDPF